MVLLTLAMTATNLNASTLCSQAEGYWHVNSTTSSTVAKVSGTAVPRGNSSTIHNSTRMYNGTFKGTPVPFTGGSGIAKGCEALVIAGVLVGGVAVAL